MILELKAWAIKQSAKLIGIGILILVFIGSNVGAYFYGKLKAKESFAVQENKILAKELELKQKEIELNAREAEEVATRAAERNARVERGLGELKDAIEEAGVNPSCDLSDDELRALEGIKES